MINETQKTNLEYGFIRFLGNMIHTRHGALAVPNPNAPKQDLLLRAEAFYSKVLLDVSLGREPRREEFRDSGFEEGDEAVYQGALYLYHRWKLLPRKQAIRCYCQYLDHLWETIGLGGRTRINNRIFK